MAQKTVRIGIEVDRETDLEIQEWADAEERSKRRHLAILARKLATLRKSHPDDLQRLGLMDRTALAPA
jgi:hypothetical protein